MAQSIFNYVMGTQIKPTFLILTEALVKWKEK